MGDYGQEYADQEARRLEAHIARTVQVLDSLAGRYVSLPGMLKPGGGGGSRDELVHFAAPGSRVPVRVDVVDTMTAVEAFVGKYGPLVRGALRVGFRSRVEAGRVSVVLAELRYMADKLGPVYREDVGLGDELSRRVWRLERRCAGVAGDVSRAFPAAEDCGACGLASLWVSPELLEVRCGNPDCRASFPVDVAAPVHTSERVADVTQSF